jgi:hypothetical protein
MPQYSTAFESSTAQHKTVMEVVVADLTSPRPTGYDQEHADKLTRTHFARGTLGRGPARDGQDSNAAPMSEDPGP